MTLLKHGFSGTWSVHSFLKSMKFIFLSMIQRRLIHVLKCDMRWYRIHPNIMIYVNVSYIGNAIHYCFVWMYVKCKWIIIPNSYTLQKDKKNLNIILVFRLWDDKIFLTLLSTSITKAAQCCFHFEAPFLDECLSCLFGFFVWIN